MNRLFGLTLGLALAVNVVATATTAHAQDWPTKPVRMIVPIAAGGIVDVAARIVADGLTAKYGQRVVVENFGGAGGIIGVKRLLQSSPDGYTFGFLPASTIMITPILYKDANYDPIKDFQPIAVVGDVPYILAVNPGSGIMTLDDLIRRAKAENGKMKFASQFIGSGAHLVAERFSSEAGIKFTMVPYRGTTDVVTSVVSGETPVTMQAEATMADLIRAGRLRAIAVTSAKRLPGWPDVPAISESIPKSESTAWFGIFGVVGTPKPIVAKFAKDIEETVRSPEVAKRFATGGIYPIYGREKELAEKLAFETPIWRKIVKDANVTVQQ
jgi:tripartite-type tricarboxylate transporter receptor subunit TctC